MEHVETLVIGGGIGGLATALAAAKAGRRVTVLERAPEFTEVGAGLQLAANATRVLDRLGVLADVADVAVWPRHLVMMSALTGERLTALDVGDAYVARYGFPYLVVHRNDLLQILLKRCLDTGAVDIHSGRTVLDVTNGTDAVSVDCADGPTYRADLAVAADGVNSLVRRNFSDDALLQTGYVTYRGVIGADQVPGGIASDNVILWVAPQLHMIQYPVRRRELYNQAAVFRSPRFGHQEWGTPDELDAAFADTCAPVRSAITRIGRDRRWPVQDRAPLRRWVDGRVALLGDAAHPMVQYLAQGACQALEDAAALGASLSDRTRSVPEDLQAYQRSRIDRAAQCQSVSRAWGDWWHTDQRRTARVRDRVLARRSASDYAAVDWLYADRGPEAA